MYGQVLIFQNAHPKRRYCKRHVSLGRSKRSARTHSYSREAVQMSSVSPKRTFKTHKTQETTATVVKTPSERVTQNPNSANFQNASFAKRSFAKRGSEFQNAVLNPLNGIYIERERCRSHMTKPYRAYNAERNIHDSVVYASVHSKAFQQSISHIYT